MLLPIVEKIADDRLQIAREQAVLSVRPVGEKQVSREGPKRELVKTQKIRF